MTTMTPHTKLFLARLALLSAFLVFLIVLVRIPGDGEHFLLGTDRVSFLEADRVSFAAVLTEITFGVSLLVSLLSYHRFSDPEIAQDHFERLNPLIRGLIRVSVAIGTATTGALAAAFLFGVIADIFQPPDTPPLVIAVISAAYGGVLAYAVGYSTLILGSRRLLMMAGLVMVVGLVLAVALSSSVDWWTRAISFLGVDEYGYIFNFTFIVAGSLLLAVMQDKLGDLDVLRRRGVFDAPRFNLFHNGGIILCLMVAGIGLFPYEGITSDIHQIVSTGAMGLFIVLALLSSRLVPVYPPRYQMMTNVIIGLAILTIIAHYGLKWVNFSYMELALLSLAAAWIVTFYAYSRGYIARHDPTLINGRAPLAETP